MNRNVPYLIVALEIAVLVFLACAFWIPAILLIPTPAPPAEIPIVAHAPHETQEPVASTVTPSATSTPYPVSTLTPDPSANISSCLLIESPGVYQLVGDIFANSKGDCIKIASSHVSLDCADYSIQGLAFDGVGISVRKYGLLASQIPTSIEIKNCRISRFRFGIFVESGVRISIHDNISSDNFDDTDRGSRYGSFLGMTEGGGIRLNSVSDSTIWSNTTLTEAIGIDIRLSNNIIVRENTSSNNSAWGINLVRTINAEISGNTTADNVRQCTWGAGVVGYGCDAGGIMLQDGSNNILVAGNQVVGRNGNGIFIKAHAQPCGDNNTITGNTVVGALYNSVELSFCSGNKINNNSFRDGLDAIWLGFAHDNEISDNVITNMKNHGIISSNSRNNMISRNRITNANIGIFFYSESYDRNFLYFLSEDGDYNSHDNCLCGNLFESNSIAVHLKDSTHNRVNGNDFRSNLRGLVMQGNSRGNSTDGNQD